MIVNLHFILCLFAGQTGPSQTCGSSTENVLVTPTESKDFPGTYHNSSAGQAYTQTVCTASSVGNPATDALCNMNSGRTGTNNLVNSTDLLSSMLSETPVNNPVIGSSLQSPATNPLLKFGDKIVPCSDGSLRIISVPDVSGTTPTRLPNVNSTAVGTVSAGPDIKLPSTGKCCRESVGIDLILD